MGNITRHFLRGLAAVLPLAITAYIIWWFLAGAENLLKAIVPGHYVVGMGIATGIVVIFLVGFLLGNWLVRWFYDLGISILERLPIVKPIYRMLSDIMGFFAFAQKNKFSQVVMVRLVEGGPEVIGFVTREDFSDLPEGFSSGNQVGVYLPLSYAMGGYLMMFDKSQVRRVDLEMNAAFRLVLTAGITTEAADEKKKKKPAPVT